VIFGDKFKKNNVSQALNMVVIPAIGEK